MDKRSSLINLARLSLSVLCLTFAMPSPSKAQSIYNCGDKSSYMLSGGSIIMITPAGDVEICEMLRQVLEGIRACSGRVESTAAVLEVTFKDGSQNFSVLDRTRLVITEVQGNSDPTESKCRAVSIAQARDRIR